MEKIIITCDGFITLDSDTRNIQSEITKRLGKDLDTRGTSPKVPNKFHKVEHKPYLNSIYEKFIEKKDVCVLVLEQDILMLKSINRDPQEEEVQRMMKLIDLGVMNQSVIVCQASHGRYYIIDNESYIRFFAYIKSEAKYIPFIVLDEDDAYMYMKEIVKE